MELHLSQGDPTPLDDADEVWRWVGGGTPRRISPGKVAGKEGKKLDTIHESIHNVSDEDDSQPPIDRA